MLLFVYLQKRHAHMEPHVLQRMAGTHVSVHKGKPAIPTKQDALLMTAWVKAYVAPIMNVRIISLVSTEHVSARARAYAADRMHIVNQKNMLAGVAVALALLKQSAVNVFRVSVVPF